MPSIIIPAHNEATVIARCIAALLRGARDDELEIIVVCNGCSDNTAGVARAFGQRVRVLETSVASKIAALNLGDEAARSFPRLFVDADVVLPLEAVRGICDALRNGKLAAAPRANVDLTNCSWPVRAFYNIDRRMPSADQGIGGSGVYALSETGRRRFEKFPQLTADDGFVRLLFRPDERVTLRDCHSTVFAARSLAELIIIKTRSHFGTAELRRLYPDRWQNIGHSNRPALMWLLRQPALWPSLIV
jgi:glycosyltransferase involved in cell wall biosynthesis